ncbi:MAG: hypothetical protein J7647_10380 [Cyanobacteria bacterium SBLK]|nr:hypothetical protein [Cyanobacteria bacterium SBLK]
MNEQQAKQTIAMLSQAIRDDGINVQQIDTLNDAIDILAKKYLGIVPKQPEQPTDPINSLIWMLTEPTKGE